MKAFMHAKTGEIIAKRTRLGALRYFKRDGKIWGYKTSLKDIVRYPALDGRIKSPC